MCTLQKKLQDLYGELSLELRRHEAGLRDHEEECNREINVLKHSRVLEVDRIVRELLPDLEMDTIKKLGCKFPGFTIPITSSFFGYRQRVDRSISLEALRADLALYLDKINGAMVESWRGISLIDSSIFSFEQRSISHKEEVVRIKDTVAILEQFMKEDLGDLDPTLEEKIHVAILKKGLDDSLSFRLLYGWYKLFKPVPSSSKRYNNLPLGERSSSFRMDVVTPFQETGSVPGGKPEVTSYIIEGLKVSGEITATPHLVRDNTTKD